MPSPLRKVWTLWIMLMAVGLSLWAEDKAMAVIPAAVEAVAATPATTKNEHENIKIKKIENEKQKKKEIENKNKMKKEKEEKEIEKEKEDWVHEISTPENWTHLRRIQAEHSPEFGLSTRFRDLEEGDGFHVQTGLRQHLREDLSMVYRIHHIRYAGDRINPSDENLTLQHLGLLFERGAHNTYSALEVGHQGRLGAELTWERILQAGAGFSLQLRRHSQDESLPSLRYSELTDSAKGGVSFTFPKLMFFNAEHSYYQSRIYQGVRSKGDGQDSILELGFNLIPYLEKYMGWQFFDANLRYPDRVPERLQLKLQQQLGSFDGSLSYFNQIARTRSSRGQSLIASSSWPLSQHVGLELQGHVGQDLERDLTLGKILGLQGRFLWVPTHMTRLELKFLSSTENTGVVRGDIFEYGVGLHVNL